MPKTRPIHLKNSLSVPEHSDTLPVVRTALRMGRIESRRIYSVVEFRNIPAMPAHWTEIKFRETSEIAGAMEKSSSIRFYCVFCFAYVGSREI